MSTTAVAVSENPGMPALLTGTSSDLVTFTLGQQIFGVPVLQVQDVLPPQKIARVPLAPTQVCGSINLRGRIATTINVRQCLGLPANDKPGSMFIVIEQKGELYSLMVDKVGDVMGLPQNDFEPNPINLDPKWRAVAGGVYRLAGQILVILDVVRLLDLVHDENGATAP